LFDPLHDAGQGGFHGLHGGAFPNVGGLLELPEDGFAEFSNAAAPLDFGPTGGVGDFPSVGSPEAGHTNNW
jgi:hypothetical protein